MDAASKCSQVIDIDIDIGIDIDVDIGIDMDAASKRSHAPCVMSVLLEMLAMSRLPRELMSSETRNTRLTSIIVCGQVLQRLDSASAAVQRVSVRAARAHKTAAEAKAAANAAAGTPLLVGLFWPLLVGLFCLS